MAPTKPSPVEASSPVGESEPPYGGEEQALIEPRRYQRKKEEWARQDLLTRMAAAEVRFDLIII